MEVCLSWYDESEYVKLQERVGQPLLPYAEWLAAFEDAQQWYVRQCGSVLVTTITADELLNYAFAMGIQVGPVASASYAVAAASGQIVAPVRRVSAH